MEAAVLLRGDKNCELRNVAYGVTENTANHLENTIPTLKHSDITMLSLASRTKLMFTFQLNNDYNQPELRQADMFTCVIANDRGLN